MFRGAFRAASAALGTLAAATAFVAAKMPPSAAAEAATGEGGVSVGPHEAGLPPINCDCPE